MRARAAMRSRRRRRVVALASLLVAALLSAGSVAAPVVSPARDAAEAGLVDVATLAPDLHVRMRYVGHDNFTGAPVPGYEANRCYLLRPAAEALARVQQALRADGLGLEIFDCYRPVRAVRSFVAWAAAPDDPASKARFYPQVDKRALVPDYIADRSGHSRAATVDLTLVRCADGRCTPLDMGTGFDLFSPAAHTDAPGLTPEVRGNRQRLVQAMAAQGFVNYPLEWWHFSLRPEPDPQTAYDVPVR